VRRVRRVASVHPCPKCCGKPEAPIHISPQWVRRHSAWTIWLRKAGAAALCGLRVYGTSQQRYLSERPLCLSCVKKRAASRGSRPTSRSGIAPETPYMDLRSRAFCRAGMASLQMGAWMVPWADITALYRRVEEGK